MSPGTCAACGHRNDPAAKFCSECGSLLARTTTCPSCGTPDQAGRFCSECGAPQEAGAAPPARTRAVERKTTSVLFGDLVGFTSLSEVRDAEEVRTLLSRYFQTARTVVERYGGVVEKFIGDAVMAVWGAPVVHEDDAERAVRAGLDLVAAVTALGAQVGAPGLAMRVGVVTGEVAVTIGAIGEGMVAGDAVNTAARVQSVASPGRVWVDGDTRRRADASITFTDAGAHRLKGKVEPVALYEAGAVVAAVGGAQRLDGLVAPLTGRERELAQVKETLHATAEDARPRFVLLTGAAGSGKSRLSWEFESYVDGLAAPVWWHRGRCPSYGGSTAFWALAEALRARFGVPDDAGPTGVDIALDSGLAEWVPDPAQRSWLLPRLATLLGGSAARPDLPRADLFGAWLAFLGLLSAADGERGTPGPVVLLIEDLQHADDGLLDFLEHAVDNARFPLYVLAVGRPEVLDRRPTLGTGRRRSSVYLEPLTDAQMALLVDGLVADLSDRARDALVARAEGLPLYAVETVRSLIDRDAVLPVDGRYVATPLAERALVEESAPASLQALVAARLDALAPAARELLQDAAVLGQSFTLDGLAALGHPPGATAELLAGLVRRDLLQPEDGDRIPRPGHFRFVQAVVRSVAYDTLSRADRRARHLATADHLDQLTDPSGELTALVAAHLLDAVDSGPGPGDGERLARARGLLAGAARRALTVAAPEEALRLATRALATAGDGTGVSDAELHDVAGQSCLQLARYPQAMAHVDAAISGHEAAGRLASAGRSATLFTFIGGVVGERAEQAQRLAPWLTRVRAAAAAATGADRVDLLDAERALSSALASSIMGMSAETVPPGIPALVELVERAVVLGERAGGGVQVRALNALAVHFQVEGAPMLADALFEHAIAVARQSGRLYEALPLISNLGAMALPHDLSRAAARLAEAAEAAERAASRTSQVGVAGNRALVGWLDGDWALSRTAQAQVEGDPFLEHTGWLLIRSIDDAEGRVPQEVPALPLPSAPDADLAALADLVAAVPLGVAGLDRMLAAVQAYQRAAGTAEEFWLVWSSTLDGAARADRVDVLTGLVDLLAAEEGLPPLLGALLAWGRGELARAVDDPAAEGQLRRAAQVLDDFGARFFAARAWLSRAQVLAAAGRADEAVTDAERAGAAFTVLGARPWADRAAALSGERVH